MKKNILKIAIFLPSLLILSTSYGTVYASCVATSNSPKSQILTGVSQSGNNCSSSGVTNIISAAVTILSLIIGVVAVIMIMWAGLKYTTAGGDTNKLASAKTTLIYALVGLVIAALAATIVRDVLGTASL